MVCLILLSCSFIEDLNDLLQREKQVYNPMKNKLCDWVDVEKLHSIYRRHAWRKHSAPLKKHASVSTRKVSGHQEQHHNVHHRRNNPLSASMREPSADSRTSNDHHRRHLFSASMKEPAGSKGPLVSGYRRTTCHIEEPTHHATTPPPRRNSSTKGSVTQDSPRSSPDLRLVLENWSHSAPKELRPLETLLLQVPTLFPPNNTAVEQHEYFSKWKEFSEDAFENEFGEELKKILKHAVRKAKVE